MRNNLDLLGLHWSGAPTVEGGRLMPTWPVDKSLSWDATNQSAAQAAVQHRTVGDVRCKLNDASAATGPHSRTDQR
jgi:hypothetical protein